MAEEKAAVTNQENSFAEAPKKNKKRNINPWAWVPSLYFAEGIPYAIVMLLSIPMYKSLNISNSEITFYTAWLGLPWVIKPLWSPFIDLFKTKRLWILSMQFFIGFALALLGLTIHLPAFFQYSLIFLFLIAFSSATHDIAADGFYMVALDEHKMTFFNGIRSVFYKIATVIGQGILVAAAGELGKIYGIKPAWSFVFIITGIFFIGIALYHIAFIPQSANDKPALLNKKVIDIVNNFISTFVLFFKKKKIGWIIAFLLFYRAVESHLIGIVQLFMLDPVNKGGIGLSLVEVGVIYGTVGKITLLLGGILAGIHASRSGLRKSLWLNFIAINIPGLVYIFLAISKLTNVYMVASIVGIEQLCYGFGFNAYLLYMMYACEGEFKTSHYAISTGFMAASMMLPRMYSGWLQEIVGYQNFFIIISLFAIPAFLITRKLPMDNPEFGKKKS